MGGILGVENTDWLIDNTSRKTCLIPGIDKVRLKYPNQFARDHLRAAGADGYSSNQKLHRSDAVNLVVVSPLRN